MAQIIRSKQRLVVCLTSAVLVSTVWGCSRATDSAARSSKSNVTAPDTFFDDATDELGINFQHVTDSPPSYFFPNIVGSGCALLDYDCDGDLDIYLVNLGAGPDAPAQEPAGNRLFQQRADGRFIDVTADSGVRDTGYGMGVAVGDINNDGFPDIYVTNYGLDHLYLNERDGSFRDVTIESGINNPAWGLSACFFDFDRDGWLDLYVANYVEYSARPCTRPGGGDQDFCSPREFRPALDRLFRNETGLAYESEAVDLADQGIRFRDVSTQANIVSQRGPGMGVTALDINGDSWQDIYVANDQSANFAWINQGNGRFVDEAVSRGCAYDALGRAQASMGVAVGDSDGNGKLELLVTHLETEHNTLYRPTESGSYIDDSIATGMREASLHFTGFGAAMLDIDHDADLDAVIANGGVRRMTERQDDATDRADLAAFWQPYAQKNLLLLNDQGYYTLPHATEPFTDRVGVSRGLATGDVDNDGDIDVLVMNTGSKARLYRNEATKHGNWLSVRVRDPRFGGRDDYGASIIVRAGESKWVRLVQPGTSYLASNDVRTHFGLGPATMYDMIEVKWSDGYAETFPGGAANRFIALDRGGSGSNDD